ncbi:MAG: hypothetical protein JWL64_953 [Frankiales bacterium]|nr:hypothetical protein [Frankiales bacterium]
MAASRSIVDERLFTGDDDPQLVGSRCAQCSTVTFPQQASCPRCAGSDVAPHPLAREGALWSWTVQAFPPKPPYVPAEGPFQPYGVGYVDLGGEVLVESRLTAAQGLRIGMPVCLVLDEWTPGRTTYAFAPVPA